MNVDLPAVVTFANAEDESSGKKILNFTAITNIPIVETTYAGKKVSLTVDLDSTTFTASKLYKDHDLRVDNVVAKIIDHKLQERPDNFKELVISAEFYPDIKESNDIYEKYAKGLLDSVSIGIKDIQQVSNKDGDSFIYRNGNIYEVSAVFDGRDPNAKIRDQFNKQIEGIIPLKSESQEEVAMSDNTENVFEKVKEYIDSNNKVMSEKMAEFASSISAKLDTIAQPKVELSLEPSKSEELSKQEKEAVSMGVSTSYEPTKEEVKVNNFNVILPLNDDDKVQLYTKRYGTHNINILGGFLDGNSSLVFKQSGSSQGFQLGQERQFQTTATEGWLQYQYDLFEAMDNSTTVLDIVRSQSDKFDTTKTTDIGSIIPTPRDTTKLWDILRKDSAILREVSMRHQPDGQTYEFSTESAPWTIKVYDELAPNEYQKYEPKKVSVDCKTFRMAVEMSYESLKAADSGVNMRAHIQRKMFRDFGWALEEAMFQSDSGNKFIGILKNTTKALTKNTDFLKTPNLENVIKIQNILRDKNYKMDNVKFALRQTKINELAGVLKLANANPSPENLFLCKNANIWGFPVVATDGLKTDEGLFGDLRNIFVVTYGTSGLDFYAFTDEIRTVKLSYWFRVGMVVADEKTILHLAKS